MKKLPYQSKAKCPICNEYKWTDLKPKQRAAKGWICTDCTAEKFGISRDTLSIWVKEINNE
jgi:hypothetical protein